MIGDSVVDWHPQANKNDAKILHNLSLLGFYTDDKLVRVCGLAGWGQRRRRRGRRRWWVRKTKSG
jgi:hypothetical protein